ncbi:MAG: DsbA family protein [Acidimicrobiales bacterium]
MTSVTTSTSGLDRTMPDSDPAYDIEFFWDPVCPFAWITSRWLELVVAKTGDSVDWRFISLRLLNKDKDYATEFPPDYEHGHTAGLRMLRVAAALRAAEGRGALAPVVEAYGQSYWDKPKGSGMRKHLSTTEHVTEVLQAAGVSTSYVEALDDESWDQLLDDETELALSRTGRDVGTPIITFRQEDGTATSFFGPVISRVPDPDEAVQLWKAVTTLAAFPGFAEMKRSLREVPQLNILGGSSPAPAEEDWTGGHRAGHLASDRDEASDQDQAQE